MSSFVSTEIRISIEIQSSSMAKRMSGTLRNFLMEEGREIVGSYYSTSVSFRARSHDELERGEHNIGFPTGKFSQYCLNKAQAKAECWKISTPAATPVRWDVGAAVACPGAMCHSKLRLSSAAGTRPTSCWMIPPCRGSRIRPTGFCKGSALNSEAIGWRWISLPKRAPGLRGNASPLSPGMFEACALRRPPSSGCMRATLTSQSRLVATTWC